MRHIGILILLGFITSCATMPPKVNFGVKSSEVRTTVIRKLDNTVVEEFQPQSFEDGVYEDSLIRAAWRPTLKEFVFELTNKTGYTITINWDEVVYVDENDMPIAVMHKGIRYLKRNETQKPSVIPSGTTHRDFIIPTENVHLFKWNYYDRFGYPITYYYWHEQRFYKEDGGQSCSIHMPITIQSLDHTYIFAFEFTSPGHENNILDMSSYHDEVARAKGANIAVGIGAVMSALAAIVLISL